MTGSIVSLIHTSDSLKFLGWCKSVEKLRLLAILLNKAIWNQQDEFYRTITKLINLDIILYNNILNKKEIRQDLIKIEAMLFSSEEKAQNPNLIILFFKITRTAF
jgi:hypothetical protein